MVGIDKSSYPQLIIGMARSRYDRVLVALLNADVNRCSMDYYRLDVHTL